MNSKWRFQIAAVSCLAAAPTFAEITLEETGETLTGDMEITQDMGITRGTNLLHSFLTFNVNAGESATFSGSNDISNICLLYTSPSPRDKRQSRMPSSA